MGKERDLKSTRTRVFLGLSFKRANHRSYGADHQLRNCIFLLLSQNLTLQLQDVLVLNNIIDAVSDRPMSKATAFSAYLDDDEDEGPKCKDIVAEKVIEGINVGCVWDCCWLWIRISEFLSLIVFDPFTELTITLCIVVNVIFMALDHYLIEYNGM